MPASLTMTLLFRMGSRTLPFITGSEGPSPGAGAEEDPALAQSG